ncbi:MAG: hypothetical protein ACTHLZ_08965 [Tepidisphaeraceae bacterium]
MSPTVALPGQSAYSVSRPAGKCAVTGQPIAPGESFMAVLNETPAGMERQDISLAAWPQVDASKALAFWKSVMPHPEQVKKKPFVDDEVLATLFERLSDAAEPQKLHFRFVLGLILMRKRLLTYEASENRDGEEYWIVKAKGKQDRLSMLNPHLTEDQVKAVSTQLGEIMNEDL